MIEGYLHNKHPNLSPLEQRPRKDLTDEDIKEMSDFSTRQALGQSGERLELAESRATRDGLTGLENITEFKRRMGQAFEIFNRIQEKRGAGEKPRKSDKYMGSIAIVILDIDHLKEINDDPRFGHNAANKVLEAVSGVLRVGKREEDSVARFGGDEFALGCPGMTEGQSFQKVEGIRKTVENLKVEWEGRQIPITMSAGVTSTKSAKTLELAMEQADQALLAVKKAGRNRTFRYSNIEKRAQKSSNAPPSMS